MKKLFIFFIFIQLYSSFVLSNEFNWTQTAKTKSGETEFYLDNQSTRSIGNYNYQWVLANYLKDFDEVKSNISYATIDCKRNKMQMVIWSEYDEYYAKGKVIGHSLIPEEDLEWHTPKSNSVMSVLIKNSCANKVSSVNSVDGENEKINRKPKKKHKFKEF